MFVLPKADAAGCTKRRIGKENRRQRRKHYEQGHERFRNHDGGSLAGAHGAEYDYNIAKGDGSILEKSVEYRYKHTTSKAKIGKKAALNKVAKFSGIKRTVVNKAKCVYKYKRNEGRYDIEFRYNGYKYEYEVLAPTGQIIEWEMERLGK